MATPPTESTEPEKLPKVLLTGPGGRIGTQILPMLKARLDLRLLDIKPIEGEPDTIVADLSDMDVLEKAMEGCDAVIHLAATSDEAPFIEKLVPNNVVGIYNMLEAAHKAKVKRFVFASTVQTIGAHPRGKTIEATDDFRPNSLYGATKALGEVMGRWYHDHRGMEFVAIRIGWFQPYDSPYIREKGGGARSIWLSPRDCAEILIRGVEAENIGYAVVFGTSITSVERLSRTPARELLGFEPQDNANDYAPKETADSVEKRVE